MLSLPVSARFLYGAPAAGLTGEAELRLQALRSPFEQHKDFLFGLVDEAFAPDLIPFDIEALDNQGNGSLDIALPRRAGHRPGRCGPSWRSRSRSRAAAPPAPRSPCRCGARSG